VSLLSKLFGGETANTTGRTSRERARRAKEIRAIDARTASWLRGGGLDPKRKTR
jgi:hypothetical protein